MWKHVGTQFPIVSVGAVMICSLLSRVWNKLGDIAAHTLRWVHQQNHGVVPVHSGTLTWRVWATNTLIIYLFGSFLKWRYPQLSSMFKWDFAWKKPSSYWGSSIYGKPPISLVIFQFNGEMTWPCCRVCKHPQEATARWCSCIQWRTCQVFRRKPVDGESHHLVGNKPWMDTDGMISWLYINYISYIMLYIYIPA